MTHDSHNRSARLEVFFVVLLFGNGILYVCTDKFRLETKLFGHEVNRFGIHTLVNADHNANAHTRTDNLCHGHVHHRGEFVGRHKFGQLEHLALCLCFEHLLFLLCTCLFALLFAILGALRALRLAGQACQGFLYLLCYVLVAYFGLDGSLCFAVAFLLSFATALSIAALGVAALVVATASVAALRLVGSSVHVHLLLSDTVALTLLAVLSVGTSSLAVFLFALFAALLLGLLLGARILVERREVDGAEHLRACHFHLCVEFEYTVLFFADGLGALFHGRLFLTLLSLGGLGWCSRLSLGLLLRLGFSLGHRSRCGFGISLSCRFSSRCGFGRGRSRSGFFLLSGSGSRCGRGFGIEIYGSLHHDFGSQFFGHSGFNHFGGSGCLLLRLFFFLLLLSVLEEFFGFVLQVLIATKLFAKQFVLCVVNLFAGRCVHLVALFGQEIYHGLQADVEFLDNFI